MVCADAQHRPRSRSIGQSARRGSARDARYRGVQLGATQRCTKNDGRRVRPGDGLVGLVDGIGNRGRSDVVVVGGAGEEPVVTRIRAGVGVRRVAQVDRTDGDTCFAVDTSDRGNPGRVGVAVVSHGIRSD